MAQQRRLHLGPGDVVPGRNDHVVAAGLKPEIAVRVQVKGVARDVPAVDHVRTLPVVGQIAAPGRPPHGEPARGAPRQVGPRLVDQLRLIARNWQACGAGPNQVMRGGDEDVQHLGGTNPVHQPQAGRVEPGMPGRGRQRLTGRHTPAQAAGVAGRKQRDQRAIGGGRREADRGPCLPQRRQQRLGRRVVQQHRAGADPQRKQHDGAEPEREGKRCRADEHVFRLGTQHARRVAIADRQHVAMKVHRPFWLPGRAGCECDQAHVVGARGVGLEQAAGRRHFGRKRIAAHGQNGDQPRRHCLGRHQLGE